MGEHLQEVWEDLGLERCFVCFVWWKVYPELPLSIQYKSRRIPVAGGGSNRGFNFTNKMQRSGLPNYTKKMPCSSSYSKDGTTKTWALIFLVSHSLENMRTEGTHNLKGTLLS